MSLVIQKSGVRVVIVGYSSTWPRLARAGPGNCNTGAAAARGVTRTVDMRDREPGLSGVVPNVPQSMLRRSHGGGTVDGKAASAAID
jgi:hypothetical protein